MALDGSKKRRAEELLALHLAAGATVAEAAAKCGVSLRTVARRQKEPAFRQLVVDTRSQLLERAAAQLVAAATEAVEVLRALLSAAGETAKLGAARAILEHALRFRENSEFAARLAALEARVGKAPDETQAPFCRRNGP